MNASSTITSPAAGRAAQGCDEATVEIIVNGHYSRSLPAIGQAGLATLQRAAQLCMEAIPDARGRGEPWKQFHYRAILCRARIRRIGEQEKASF